MIALGVFAAVEISRRRWRARGGDPDDISAIAIWAVPAGLIGARIYHVITDNELYRGHWFDVPVGQGRQLAAGHLERRPRHPRRHLPRASWSACGSATGGACGCRSGSTSSARPWPWPRPSAGSATTSTRSSSVARPRLPWGLEISPAHRPIGYEQFATFQPTFLYEALWNLALAGLLVLIDRRRVLRPGRIFVLYIGGYAVGRFIVESLRSDKANEILGLRVNIWTSLVTFVGVLDLPGRRRPAPPSGRLRRAVLRRPPLRP